MNWSDFFQNIIPVSGIITAIVLPVVPLIFFPLIDYTVTKPVPFNNSRVFLSDISITNFGGFAARNVTVSIIAKNVSILNIDSEPYLPNKTASFDSKILNYTGRGLFVADKLLPHATIILHTTMYVPTFADSEKFIVYVLSDETVGYHGIVNTILAYIVVALTLAFVSMYCLTRAKPTRWFLALTGGVCSAIVAGLLLQARI